MSRLTEIIVNLGCKLGEIFQTVYGWIAAAGIFVMNFFAGYETAINAVVICVALDTVWESRRRSNAGISRFPSWGGTACCRNWRCMLR